LRRGRIEYHGNHAEDGWRVTLADTGEKTMTGGRITRIANYVGASTFMATCGDGGADDTLDRSRASGSRTEAEHP
jgi:glucose-1-phosphate cytidylyltransferase